MGSTYGGNALACAAAVATIDLFQSENLLANVKARGAQLKAGLKALQKQFPAIKDVRACEEDGLLLVACGSSLPLSLSLSSAGARPGAYGGRGVRGR